MKLKAVKYETRIIKFRNYEKQIPIPFKSYADTECLLERMINVNTHHYIKSIHLILQEQNWFALIANLLYQLKFLQEIIASIILLNAFLINKKELMK